MQAEKYADCTAIAGAGHADAQMGRLAAASVTYLILKGEGGASDRIRTDDIQNHNLAL